MEIKRIQRRRTKGWRMPSTAKYVGRGTKWGNPFVVGEEMTGWQKAFVAIQSWPVNEIIEHYRNGDLREPLTLEDSLRYYKMHIKFQIQARNLDLSELKGKDLACWCALDKPCHADILIELANEIYRK